MKKKIIYLLLVILTLFGFNRNVYADLKSDAKSKNCDDLISDGTLDKSNSSLLLSNPKDVNCIYTYSVGDTCNILQFTYDSSTLEYEYDAITPIEGGIIHLGGDYYSHELAKEGTRVGSTVTYPDFDKSELSRLYGQCPIGVRYSLGTEVAGHYLESSAFNNKVKFIINSEEPNMKLLYQVDIELNIPPLITDKDDVTEVKDCKDILGDDGINAFKVILNIIKIFVPIILTVMGTLDFAQAIFASNDDGIKKAQSKFIKRLIISVIIFLIPNILSVILSIAHSVWPVIDSSLCGILS